MLHVFVAMITKEYRTEMSGTQCDRLGEREHVHLQSVRGQKCAYRCLNHATTQFYEESGFQTQVTGGGGGGAASLFKMLMATQNGPTFAKAHGTDTR
jgi:hypothetical protein